MKVSGSVYVVQAVDDLAIYGIYKTPSEWPTFSGLDQLVQISLHTLEDEV
jgi:hypothetical protein